MQQVAQDSGKQVSDSLPAGWETEHPPATSAFEGFLARFAGGEEKPLPAWNDEALAEDVATLSYERALKAHARYHPRDFDDRSLTEAPAMGPQQAGNSAGAPGKETGEPASSQRSLKSASVTIRMSAAECERLHHRAAEAGLTVSAYLRSCAFEMESLRKEVKEMLAQMRPAEPAELPAAPGCWSWFRRVLSR